MASVDDHDRGRHLLDGLEQLLYRFGSLKVIVTLSSLVSPEMHIARFVIVGILIARSYGDSAFAQSSLVIDLREYMTVPLNNYMLCQSNNQLCTTSRFNEYGEFQLDYTNGITGYIARSSGNNYLVGSVRSYDDTDGLRCFSNVGQYCTAPSNSNFMPGNIPMITSMNVVPLQIELNGENSDGSPKFPLQYSTGYNNGQAYQFGVVSMDPATCAQTYEGAITAGLYWTYVQGIPFGGDIGTQDAVVIEEVEAGATASQNHMERYFYVKNVGIVREGSSYYDPSTGYYDRPLGGNSVRNVYSSSNITPHPVQCPQGTVTSLQAQN